MKHKNTVTYIKITQIHNDVCKNNQTQRHEQQQNQLEKLFIGNLNVSVTIDYIYELFVSRTTKYFQSNLKCHLIVWTKNRFCFCYCTGSCKKLTFKVK